MGGLFAGVEAPKRLIVNHFGLGGQEVREHSGVVGNICGDDVFPNLRFDSITSTELPEFWQFVLEIGRITQRTFGTGFTANVAGPNSGGRRKMNEGRVEPCPSSSPDTGLAPGVAVALLARLMH